MQRRDLALFLTTLAPYGISLYEKIYKNNYKFLKTIVCLQLQKRTRKGAAEFKDINWLNTNDRFSRCVSSTIYNFLTMSSQNTLMKFIFVLSNARSSFQRLKLPLRKLRKSLNSTSYSVPSFWSKLPPEIKGEKA